MAALYSLQMVWCVLHTKMARVTVAISTLIGWTCAVSRSPGALAIVWQLEFVSIQPLSRKSRVPEREEAGQGLRVTWACCRGRETERPSVRKRDSLFSRPCRQSEITPLITVFCQMSLKLLKSLSSTKGHILHLFSSLFFSYNVTQDFSKSSRTITF